MARDPNALMPPSTQQFILSGGVDQVSPAMALKPGVARDALNFECNVLGGYTRIAGYERFDGRVKPSEQFYAVMTVTQTTPFEIGQTVFGALSNAQAVVAYNTTLNGATMLVLVKVQGTFIANENLTVGGVVFGKALTDALRSAGPTPQLDAQWRKYGADVYRADIQKVPGSGRILGVWMYNDIVYAFRNAEDGLSARMWKATSSGWVQVTTPTLQPHGFYEFETANFGGTTAMRKMYGVDGVNKGFVFDGTTFTQITTGMSPDAPQHLAYHKQFLFYSFRASLQHSSIGDPTAPWSVVTGAGELALGDNITSIKSYTSGTSGGGSTSNAALLIHTQSTTQILYGSSELDFSLSPVSTQQGGLANTIQLLDQPYFISDLGVVNLSTTQRFGNFEQASLSQQMNPFIAQEKARSISSCIVREKSQYRVFFSDGYALYLSFVNGKIIGLMPINLNIQVSCICSQKISSGEEVMFFGDNNGMVYQMDKGPNFDGNPIPAYIHLSFSAFKSPRLKKAWKRGTLEMSGTGYFEIALATELGWGSMDIGSTPAFGITMSLKQALWDQFVWDQFFWDGQSEGPTVFPLDGSSENISLRLVSEGDCFTPFTVSSVLYHFLMRRQLRSDN